MCILLLYLVTVSVPVVFGQEVECYSAGSVAGAAVGAFLGALLLVAVAFYLRRLYLRSREGKHLVFTTDPESVKDEFAFDNPGFKGEEKRYWQNEAPTLPLGKQQALKPEFVKPDHTKDDMHVHRGRTRRVKLWARDFTGLGLMCGGGAKEGVHVHSVLRNGPAAAAMLQPGDKIKSIKIEFSGTPLEDAVSIMSLASPYPVELEVIEGGRTSGQGRPVAHPLLKRAGSTGDVNALEKEGKHLHPPRSPSASHSNNSTLESKQTKTGIKKILTDNIIANTLERNRKEKQTTLERENEKNYIKAKNRHSDITPSLPRPDKVKNRYSTGTEVQENGVMHVEQAEVQKRESNDPKKAMKFGIRVLPPNVPDDGVLKQKNIENGIDKIPLDETDKPQIKIENEIEIKKPVVAKRREKMAPPIPNVRTKINESDLDVSRSEVTLSTFTRNEINSSGIKRDENGIPQELPPHMFEAARAARNNRKSSIEIDQKQEKPKEKYEAPKPNKKSKGKAPSPPEYSKSDDNIEDMMKSEDSILEDMKKASDFLEKEKRHASLDHDEVNFTSTPKANKTKHQTEEIEYIMKPYKKESDSLNNFYTDSKSNLSNLSSNQDISNKSDVGSTTIELNNSDITIHSSPLNLTLRSVSDENERKATSLGDLSRFDKSKASLPSSTLERAQSLDISADDDNLSPKKRKSNSVVETSFFDSGKEDSLPEIMEHEKSIKKEPRLSLNITKTSAMDGLNTFQRNRLKKASEFGNLEDAIVKGSNSSIESEVEYRRSNDIDLSKDVDVPNGSDTSTEDIAKRIMDENLKAHLKLVSEFNKLSKTETMEPTSSAVTRTQEKSYHDTNIPDDMKVSRSSYANSLERPKSDMMKKLLAKNPILNVHVDQETPMTDSSKSAIIKPDSTPNQENYDEFVSNIRVGSNNSLQKTQYSEPKKDNVITVSTKTTSYTDVGENTRKIFPNVLEEIRKRGEERTSYIEPSNVAITVKQEPVQKTVTVNVTEDEFGNKVITQNVETVSSKYITATAPLEIEQLSFGMMKNSKDFENMLQEGDIKEVDRKILQEIKQQNPNLHFTDNEPSYTKTETIILNTDLEENEAKALMEKLKNDPSFMARKSPEELSKLGIRIIRDLDETKIEEFDTEMTKTRYTIDTSAVKDNCKNEHITEIQVSTPKKDKINNRQRIPEQELSYELDMEFLNDFISNERNHSAKLTEVKKPNPKIEKRHSDFDLPRNSQIMFRTATYESPKGTIVTSTDLENRRLSQLDQMHKSFDQTKPAISAKPSNIPVKAEKKSPNVSSKIPIFNIQKSLSQENLSDKNLSLARSPPKNSTMGNVTVTSIIKSSSKNPSGKL